ncbi:MAG: class I SAM-dependent RNA methyltransferase [Nitrospinae bacterium]|nr:class I SAM-dependent RNA methyltransferase [Nitrospinota bacterium]
MDEVFTLRIESLAFGGAGVGRREGKVIFVPGAFPGEAVRVKILRDHARYAEAEIVGMETPSPQRRESACPYDAECGGCPLLRLDYAAQLEWKRQMVEEQFAHIAKVAVSVSPVLPSPVGIGYRARARLKAGFSGGKFQIGFCKPKSHHIVEIARCAVANEGINATIPELRSFFATHTSPSVGAVKLETGFPERGGRVTLEAEGAIPADFLERLLFACPSVKGASAIWQSGARHIGDASLEVLIADGMSLRYGPGVFSQINPKANIALIENVLKAVNPLQGDSVLDLYCGAGNLTFPLARAGAEVTGVEFSRDAVEDAEENKTRLGFSNTAFIQGDAGKHARRMVKEGKTFNAVLLDPPRGGAPGLAPTLTALAKEKIVYISCYPPALARDAAEIVKHGFILTNVQPVDMFPHTSHVESIAVFERK